MADAAPDSAAPDPTAPAATAPAPADPAPGGEARPADGLPPPRPSLPARVRLLLVLAAVMLFGVFGRGHLDNTDAQFSLHAARAFWLRGNPGLVAPGQFPAELPPWPAERLAAGEIRRSGNSGMEGPDGRIHVWFPIGYTLAMVPAVAVGESLRESLPGPEHRLEAERGPIFGAFFWARFLASWIGPLSGAASLLALFALARVLGRGAGESALIAGLTAVGSQLLGMSPESLSDNPGMASLLWTVVLLVGHRRRNPAGRYPSGRLSLPPNLVLAGALAGLAVLMRYPHAALVAAAGAWFVAAAWWAARSRTQPGSAGRGPQGLGREIAALACGGVPFLVLFLGLNAFRFGDPFETGYGAASLGGWFGLPFWKGFLMILFAASKGLLWTSPLLGYAIAVTVRRGPGGSGGSVRLLAWLLFLPPVLLFSLSPGWQSGTVWGNRYLAPGVVLLIAVALAVSRPWRAGGRRGLRLGLLGLLTACGLFSTVTSLLAPMRSFDLLASTACETLLEGPLADGRESKGNLPLHYYVDPRFSVFHAHWTYAGLALSGDLGATAGDEVTEALFGLPLPEGREPVPIPWEDRAFRHLWWRYLADLTDRTYWPIAVLMLGLAAALGAWGLRLARRAETRLSPRDPVPPGLPGDPPA